MESRGTYHSQLRAVGCLPRGILAVATIVARMSGRHALDGQHAAASTHLSYQYVLVLVIE